MATPKATLAARRVFSRCISILQQPAGVDQSNRVGAHSTQRIMDHIWVCEGVPTGAAPSGMLAGDWILDTTNNDVYWYISGTTYVKLNRTS